MVNCCLFRCQSIDGVSPYVCSDYFVFGLGCLVAIFWGKAALSLDDMFSLYFDYLYIFYIYRFGFEGWIWVLIASVPDL